MKTTQIRDCISRYKARESAIITCIWQKLKGNQGWGKLYNEKKEGGCFWYFLIKGAWQGKLGCGWCVSKMGKLAAFE